VLLLRGERFYHPASAHVRAPVAVSACLLGEPVRYDGTDKYLDAVGRWLDGALQLVPVCPEVGAGLGVPRPPVRLVQSAAGTVRAVGRDDPILDATAALRNYAERSARELCNEHSLCGYLWKSRSPSCGLGSTPLFDNAGREMGVGSGIQADYFQTELPWLACSEETALGESTAAQRFILQCRLVFDVLYASAAPLTALHSHYQFLTHAFSADDQMLLATAAAAGARANYLATLHTACRRLQIEQLLDLFTVK
jgi:uncharacterized protein YbbK (DUF523 family)